MKTFFLSLVCAGYLYGASEDPQKIISEVANLRQKYEECRQSQDTNAEQRIKGYQKRIAVLEGKIKESTAEIARLQKQNQITEQELGRKKGIIQSLEKTLTSRDEQYRASVARNEQLTKEANAVKVGKIERENLTKALAKAKEEAARLQNDLKKSSPEKIRKELDDARTQIAKLRSDLASAQSLKPASSGESDKIKALQNELANANATILQMQKTAPKEKIVTKVVEPTEKVIAMQNELNAARAEIVNLKNSRSAPVVKEKIVEKVVYRDRPVEKIVTKTVESSARITSLESELASARATIEKLKHTPASKEKIVEKVVYKDRVLPQEKVVYRDKPVEKIVYRDRPVIQEKIVTKTIEPTEKINALQDKLSSAESQIAKLKAELAASRSRTASTAAVVPVVTKAAAKPAVAVSAVNAKSTQLPSETPKKTKSSAYRMASEAPIYNAPGGAQVDRWEARRSFTAGAPSGGWVHITGYFVNRVWQPTRDDEHLWVRESDVIRR